MATTYYSPILRDDDYQLTQNAMNVAVFNDTVESFKLFVQQIFAPNAWDSWTVGDVTSAVTSIRVYPFNFKTSLPNVEYDFEKIKLLGKYLTAEVRCALQNRESFNINFGTYTFTRKYNDFRDFEPYRTCKMYLPFVGYVDISLEEVYGKQVSVNYVTNILTGRTTIYVDLVNERTLFTTETNLSIEISTSNTNGGINNMAMIMGSLQAITAVGSLGAGIALAGVSGAGLTSYGMMHSGTTQLTSINGGVLGNVLESTRPHAYKGTQPTSNGGWYGPRKVFLLFEEMESVNYDDVKSRVGLPLMKTKNLSLLTGYTECSEVRISSAIATVEELEEIKRLLLNGIIL